MLYFFPGLFFIIFSYFGSFMVIWGFGVGVLYWVFGVGLFHLMGFGARVWGLLGFWGWGALYKHKRITLGKMVRRVSSNLFNECHVQGFCKKKLPLIYVEA